MGKSIVILNLILLFSSISRAGDCEWSRRQVNASLAAVGATLATSGGARVATGTAAVAEKKAINGIIGAMCGLSDRSRAVVRGRLDPSKLKPVNRAEITNLFRQLEEIARQPGASRRAKAIARWHQEKILSNISKSISASRAARRGQQLNSKTLKRVRGVSGKGFFRGAGRLALKGLGLIGALLWGTPANGNPEDAFLVDGRKRLPEFFDLPADVQVHFLKNSKALERAVNEYLDEITGKLGGAPKELNCSQNPTTFKLNPSGPQAIYRSIEIEKGADGKINTLLAKEYDLSGLIHEVKVEFSDEKAVRFIPKFYYESRSLKPLQRPHSAQEFKKIAENRTPIGTDKFIQDMGQIELYLGLIESDLEECGFKPSSFDLLDEIRSSR